MSTSPSLFVFLWIFLHVLGCPMSGYYHMHMYHFNFCSTEYGIYELLKRSNHPCWSCSGICFCSQFLCVSSVHSVVAEKYDTGCVLDSYRNHSCYFCAAHIIPLALFLMLATCSCLFFSLFWEMCYVHILVWTLISFVHLTIMSVYVCVCVYTCVCVRL